MANFKNENLLNENTNGPSVDLTFLRVAVTVRGASRTAGESEVKTTKGSWSFQPTADPTDKANRRLSLFKSIMMKFFLPS